MNNIIKINRNSNSGKQELLIVSGDTKEKIKPYIGKVPLDWITRAAKLPGKTLHVALLILHTKGLSRKKGETFKVQTKLYEDFGITRQVYYRALKALEKNGLIHTEKRNGSLTKITVIE